MSVLLKWVCALFGSVMCGCCSRYSVIIVLGRYSVISRVKHSEWIVWRSRPFTFNYWGREEGKGLGIWPY